MAALRGSWPWALALAVLALAGGLGAGLPALVHMGYLLLGLLLLCLAYTRLSLWTLDVEHRAAATRIALGDRLLEVYVARTRAPWPIFNVDVVAHRLILRRGAASGRSPAEELVQALLDRVPVPGAVIHRASEAGQTTRVNG